MGLRLAVSAAPLLRLVRTAPVPHISTLQAIGVDERTWRRGHRYGTRLVDLAMHCVVDLLPDRSATTVKAWLAQHPTITVLCRDRSDLSASPKKEPQHADAVCPGDPLSPVLGRAGLSIDVG